MSDVNIFWVYVSSDLVLYKQAVARLRCFFWRRIYSTNNDCFVVDSSGFHLTFVIFCPCLSLRIALRGLVILLCRPIRAPDQILGRLYIISMTFLSLRHRRLSHKMSPGARGEERLLYLWAIPLFPTFLFFTAMLSDSIALLPHSLETVLVMALFYNVLCLSQLRYYMHGVCREGENCQYSHDLKDKPSMVGS